MTNLANRWNFLMAFCNMLKLQSQIISHFPIFRVVPPLRVSLRLLALFALSAMAHQLSRFCISEFGQIRLIIDHWQFWSNFCRKLPSPHRHWLVSNDFHPPKPKNPKEKAQNLPKAFWKKWGESGKYSKKRSKSVLIIAEGKEEIIWEKIKFMISYFIGRQITRPRPIIFHCDHENWLRKGECPISAWNERTNGRL